MSRAKGELTYRHRLPVRILHWINLACLAALFMSGLQVFNAHPALYWGQASRFDQPALALSATRTPSGEIRGVTRVGSFHADTTGVLGASKNASGVLQARGFPAWATIPGPRSLADGRSWHFFFAWLFVINGLIYWFWAWRSRHFRQDLAPTGAELRGIGGSIREHLKFKHPTGADAARYNILQKLAYLAVIVVFGPGIVLMGLAMSPHMDSVLGWLVDLVGGRQSARTWHFIIAFSLLAFMLVHVFMVLVSGPLNQVRSMITGRYRIPPDPVPEVMPDAITDAASGPAPASDAPGTTATGEAP